MIDDKRKKEAKGNFDQYLLEGLIKKEKNPLAEKSYLKNAEQSLQVAEELMKSGAKPYLWVIVASYYSMFYIANAVLLRMGYKTGSRIAHKVTGDALLVLVLDKLKKELLEDYESMQKDAFEIASIRAEELLSNYDFEKEKRSRFQYDMFESAKESKAQLSLKRAKEFVFEMQRLLK